MPSSLTVDAFVKKVEAGEGAGRGEYDWAKIDALIEKGRPFTVAQCEKLMPEVPYRNYIRNYLERLVRNKTLFRTPKNQSRTFYLSMKVYEEHVKAQQAKAKRPT